MKIEVTHHEHINKDKMNDNRYTKKINKDKMNDNRYMKNNK